MTEIHARTKYCDESARIEWGHYHDGSVAMRIVGLETMEPLMTATVCMSGYDIKPATGNVIIKDYAENEGIYECLRDEGIIGPPVAIHPCGWAEVAECPLLVEVP